MLHILAVFRYTLHWHCCYSGNVHWFFSTLEVMKITVQVNAKKPILSDMLLVKLKAHQALEDSALALTYVSNTNNQEA